jgi:hypothetical protein
MNPLDGFLTSVAESEIFAVWVLEEKAKTEFYGKCFIS